MLQKKVVAIVLACTVLAGCTTVSSFGDFACSDGAKPLREDIKKLADELAKTVPFGGIFVDLTEYARQKACEQREAAKATGTKGAVKRVSVPVGDKSVTVRFRR